MKTPEISIIVVSWNAKKHLDECLHSIIQHSKQHDAEIIVVDNDSSDGSQEYVKRNFPNVNLICNVKNLGFAKANNIGISHSRGKYVFLINSDVVVYESTFNSLLDYIKKHLDVGVVGPKINGADGKIQRSYMGCPTLWDSLCCALFLDTLFPRMKIFNGFMMRHLDTNSVQQVDIINGCFWAVRREALSEVGLLDDSFFMYGEDMDWCKRFNSSGWKVIYFPLTEVLHYGGASSSNAPIRFYVEMQKANLKFWSKHYGKSSKILHMLIIFLHQLLRAIANSVLYLLFPAKRNASFFKIKRSLAVVLFFLKMKTSWQKSEGVS